MKTLTDKNIIKRIAILLIVVMSFSFIVPNTNVYAGDGGDLLNPIVTLLMFFGDSIMNILQNNFLTETDILIEAQADEYKNFNGWALFTVILSAIFFVVGICMAIPTGGASVIGSIKAFAVGAAVVAGSSFVFTQAGGTLLDGLSGNFDIPLIQYTPYAIFSGQIPALDINFIDPMDPVFRKELSQEERNDLYAQLDDELMDLLNEEIKNGNLEPIFDEEVNSNKKSELIDEVVKKYGYTDEGLNLWEYENKYYILQRKERVQTGTGKIKFRIRVYDITEYKDSIEQTLEEVNEALDENKTYYDSSASILQTSISTWYKTLRLVALVGLLSVLIYVGIRILFTSIAADKAKYKKMLIDWIVALCILFILHYVMVFILTISTKITNIIIPKATNNLVFYLPESTKIGSGDGKKLATYAEEQIPEYEKLGYTISENNIKDSQGRPSWVGDYVGYIRLVAGVDDGGTSTAYGIMYLVLVIYTCMFTFMYLKRTLYMAFLTMIAPLIALTYPLDKIKDGKAQAFSLWLREFIFNALIQPVHLILYTMIMSTVLNLAVEHPVYAIVALGFFTPAERFIRKMFGFESAGTISALGQMAGGAAVMSAVNKLSRLNKRKKKDGDEEGSKDRVRTKDEGGQGLDLSSIMGGNGNPNGGADNNNSANDQNDGNSTQRQSNQSQSEDDYEDENFGLYANAVGSKKENEAENDYEDENFGLYANAVGNKKEEKKENNENNSSSDSPVNNPNNTPVNNSSNNDSSNNRSQTKESALYRGMRSVGNHYRKKILKAKPMRAIGKFTGMAVGAATLGTVGLAAGIASGDASKALSYTAAGAGVGGALGGTVAENTMDEGASIKESFKKGYQGEEEYNNRKLDREYYEGNGFEEMVNKQDLYSHLKGRERTKAMKQDIQAYRSAGITDNKQIATCMRAGLTPEQGIYASILANGMKDSEIKDDDKKAEYIEKSKSLLRSKNLSDAEISKICGTINNL